MNRMGDLRGFDPLGDPDPAEAQHVYDAPDKLHPIFVADVDIQVIHHVRADVESQFTPHNSWHPYTYSITAEVNSEWSVDESEV